LAEPTAGRTTASQPAGEDSKGIAGRWRDFGRDLRASGASGWAIFALGVVGAILLVVAEFSNLRHTTVITASCRELAGASNDKCSATGGQQHSYALLPIAFFLLVMTWGAAVGRARAAAAAMIVIGVAVLVIAIAFDLPDTRKVGVLAEDFSNAKEHAGPAIPLELIGGGLAIVGGLLAWRRRRYEEEPQ
jgi:hypothetical protein